MQGGFPAHEVDESGIFDPGQKVRKEKIIVHGFSGGLYGLLHVFISKTVVTFQIAITIQNDVHNCFPFGKWNRLPQMVRRRSTGQSAP